MGSCFAIVDAMFSSVAFSANTLARRMLRQVFVVAAGASLLFGLLFLGLYRAQLAQERGNAAADINRLLQVSLENAMLKRDVPGLREIVARMGEQSAIRDVQILAPGGEVRFASDPQRLGSQLPDVVASLPDISPTTAFLINDRGQEVLRSVNPVPNRAPCVVCHGPVERHPVNGVLVVDYDADTLHQAAYRSALLFALAGSAVLVLTLWTLWRILRREVMTPLALLDVASRQLAEGDLARRLPSLPQGEFQRMGEHFNLMADRLVAQLQLARSQEHYLQQLLDGLPDGVRVIRQRDYAVVLANAAFLAQQGRAAVQVIGQPCYQSSHGLERPCVSTMVVCPLHELQVPGQHLRCQHRHCPAGGEVLPVEVHAVLIEAGEPPERLILESIRDLSGVVKLSQEQRLSELGLLAAGIAHEIHNPLGSLRIAVEGLLRIVANSPPDPARITGYLQMMDAEVDRCTGVTRRLLLLSRPPQQQPLPVNLNLVVADTLGLLEFDAISRGIAQKLDLDEQGPLALGDDSDLRMVVLNMAQNAFHAMPEGGELRVSTRQQEDQVVLRIADTGHGIPSELLEKIFDPFFSRRADGEAGTGLGLTICKNIVERYGGRIDVASIPGEGACFSIILPLARKNP